MADTNNIAIDYCEWAINETERFVPKYVKLQCLDWLNIANGNDNEAFVDMERCKTINNIIKLIIHPDLGKPISETLEPHARLFIFATLCTMSRDNPDRRFYETALLKIARKNFKTFVSAVIFILLMIMENDFSRFFSVAPDLKLSKELQLAIRKIIKSSPALSDEDNPAFKTLRSEVRCLLTDSEYTPLAYSEDKMDGKLANAFLADEAGAMDSYPIEAMRSSQITLFNKLGIIISTEYPNDNNGFTDEVDKAKKTLDKIRPNRKIFSLIFEPDEDLIKDDAWMDDDRIIFQANPVALVYDHVQQAIKELREDAIVYPNKRENFLCKHLNIKYKSLGTEGFVEITKVKQCSRKTDLNWWKGRKVWLGLDLSMSDDNVSVAMLTYDSENLEECTIYSRTMGFVPKEMVKLKSKREDVDYERLIREGSCISCGEEVISYLDVENYILNLEKELGVKIMQVGYDKWNAISTIQKLEAKGIECVEVKQHSSVLHSPTKLLKEKILRKKYEYDENLMLEINFQNARCTEDTNKNKYVNKKKSQGKVDQVVSNIIATYLIEQELLYSNYCGVQ